LVGNRFEFANVYAKSGGFQRRASLTHPTVIIYSGVMTHLPAPAPDFSQGNGLLPAIAQDAETGEVLMLAYMNRESFAETLATGKAVYYSRSRGKLWRKGEQSGHEQHVQGIFVDCDGDTILLKVEQQGGAACHQGYKSCFFRQVTPQGVEVIAQQVFDPTQVYHSKG
jgi:phosphoribosyl-AMP cyclohydrolase